MAVNSRVDIRRGPCEPRCRFKSRCARQGQRTHDRRARGRIVAGGGEIRRDLGGFQRPRSRRRAEGTVRRDRSAGRGRAGDAGSAGGALRRILRRLRQFGAVAGAAFARRSDPRLAGRLSLLSRSERLHGARAAAIPEAGHGVLDSGLSFPGAGRGIARSRRHPADRLLPAYAVAGARHHRRRAASSRTGRGDAGLRSDRIPDRGRLRKFPVLCPVGSGSCR